MTSTEASISTTTNYRGYEISTKITGYAYPKNGYAHNTTPRKEWISEFGLSTSLKAAKELIDMAFETGEAKFATVHELDLADAIRNGGTITTKRQTGQTCRALGVRYHVLVNGDPIPRVWVCKVHTGNWYGYLAGRHVSTDSTLRDAAVEAAHAWKKWA